MKKSGGGKSPKSEALAGGGGKAKAAIGHPDYEGNPLIRLDLVKGEIQETVIAEPDPAPSLPYQSIEERDRKLERNLLRAIDSNNPDRVRDVLFDLAHPNQLIPRKANYHEKDPDPRNRRIIQEATPDPRNAIIHANPLPKDMHPIDKFSLLMSYSDRDHEPLLHRAINAGAKDVVALFLDGLNPDQTTELLTQRNSKGQNPFDVVVELGKYPAWLAESTLIMRVLHNAANPDVPVLNRCFPDRGALLEAIATRNITAMTGLTRAVPAMIKTILLEENPDVSREKKLLQSVAESRDDTFIQAFTDQFPPIATFPLLIERDKHIVNTRFLPTIQTAIENRDQTTCNAVFGCYSPSQRGFLLQIYPDLLTTAVSQEDHTMAALLLKDIDPSKKVALLQENPTLLHSAAGKATSAMLDTLLDGIEQKDTKPLLAQKNASGATPLHVAAEKGHALTAESLLKKGANPTARVNASFLSKGQTPAGVAKAKGYMDLERTLREAKTSPNGDSRWVSKVEGEKKSDSSSKGAGGGAGSRA